MKNIFKILTITVVILLVAAGYLFLTGKIKQKNELTLKTGDGSLKFKDNFVLSLDNFKKIRDFAELNDISKNPNRDFVIVSGFEVESFGNYKPFDRVSISGLLDGVYHEYVFTEDQGLLSFSVIHNNNYENISDSDISNMQEMAQLILNGINNPDLLKVDKWGTYKSDYGFEFKYPQDHKPYKDEETNEPKLIFAEVGDRNIKIASSPHDPNPSGKFFQTEMPYMRIKAIKGIYGPENWLSTRKNEYFPDNRDIKSQRKIDIDGKVAVELVGPGNIGALYKAVAIQGKKNLIIITQDLQTDLFDTILSTFKFIK